MRIRYTQSGGFAGLYRSVDVDTNDLSQEQSSQVQCLVESATLDRITAAKPARTLPDEITYEINVETADRRYDLVLTDSTIPPAIRPLLQWLQRHSAG